MRTLAAIAMAPVLGHTTDLGKTCEDVAVEHLGAQAAIEAFDVSVLRRLAGLDMHQLDAVRSAHSRKA